MLDDDVCRGAGLWPWPPAACGAPAALAQPSGLAPEIATFGAERGGAAREELQASGDLEADAEDAPLAHEVADRGGHAQLAGDRGGGRGLVV